MRILIVEDEKVLAETLKKSLEKSGYAVDILFDGEEAERRIQVSNKDYDLLILDWMLPSREGVQICRNIRAQKISTPVLMLTARFEMKDKVAALDSGADDYLVKPFSLEELEARVRALLRRPVQSIEEVLRTGRLKLDITKRQAFINEKRVRLTAKEFSLLEYLMRNIDKVISRDQIIDHLWGFDFDSFSNVVDSHMKNLRAKINTKSHPMIETVRGYGYRIKSI